jgi:hypothetical protein
MKTIVHGLGLAVLAGLTCKPAPKTDLLKPHPVFSIRRGTNISHWLSQSDRRGEARRAWFTEEDVEFLAGLGFDHLRIPVDEEQLWDEKGNMEKEAFTSWTRDWIGAHGPDSGPSWTCTSCVHIISMRR